jgi:hypothetical protein
MYEPFLTLRAEQYRRQDERRYAEMHQLAKENGLPVSYYRKLACTFLINAGERLIKAGKQLQTPIEGAPRPAVARMK